MPAWRTPHESYYRADLALVHHLGFGFHADDCAPGGLLAIDLCDLAYAEGVPGFPVNARLADGWAIITERSTPSPDRFVRQMAVFTRNEHGS